MTQSKTPNDTIQPCSFAFGDQMKQVRNFKVTLACFQLIIKTNIKNNTKLKPATKRGRTIIKRN